MANRRLRKLTTLPFSGILRRTKHGKVVVFDLLLGRFAVVDPSQDIDTVQDVLIEDGKIAAVGEGLHSDDGT